MQKIRNLRNHQIFLSLNLLPANQHNRKAEQVKEPLLEFFAMALCQKQIIQKTYNKYWNRT